MVGYDTRDPGGTGNKILPTFGLTLPLPLLDFNRGPIALAEANFKGGEFLVGNRYSLADLIVGVALQYVDFRYPHDWRAASPFSTARASSTSCARMMTSTGPKTSFCTMSLFCWTSQIKVGG